MKDETNYLQGVRRSFLKGFALYIFIKLRLGCEHVYLLHFVITSE